MPDLHWRAILAGNPHHGLSVLLAYDLRLRYAVVVIVAWWCDGCRAAHVPGGVACGPVETSLGGGGQSELGLCVVSPVAG